MTIENLPNLAFLDVETTGLMPHVGDRVCEIAILRRNSDGEIIRWNTLVNPCRDISQEVSNINQITNEMVSSAPEFFSISQKVLEMLDNAYLVAHNAGFDISFLNKELEICGLSLPKSQVIDTLQIARKFFKFPSNSLQNIAKYIDLEVEQKHRAMADVDTMYKVFHYLLNSLKKQGISDISKIISSYV
ncbi:exonuclease domain-containing protein [Elusimicrobiota bacterium]